MHQYRLAYKDADELIASVGIARFTQGSRITVKVEDGSDYIFSYVSSQGDRFINGLSAVRKGRGVTLDLEKMTLTEHG
jgi:hypothetical protein